ncbi:MAG: radical SAM protein [Lachnospiraceae bacterium]|nr:radical SAM protein [Lachnospiraceae bacterium]
MIKMNKLILCFIPTNFCNFKCEYCVVSQTNEWERSDILFKYSVEHIIKAFNKKRLGGDCYINLTAQGETLLYKDIVPLARGLLEEGHAVEIVTNGSVTKKIDEILGFDEELLKRLFFKFSYHYKEIRDTRFEKMFWDNVRKIKKSPASFTVELMPHDEISGDIDDICRRCNENIEAVCHATVGRNDKKNSKELLTNMTKAEYVSTWGKLKSTMFDLKMDLFGVKRKEFCYAGMWSLLVDISSGEASQCYGRMNTQNIFEDLTKAIHFMPVGYSCTQSFCFNGHAHVAWGIIPELESPSYYEVRNRTCDDGVNWVKKDCEVLFKQKFADNNKEYSKEKKIIHTIVNPFFLFASLFHDIPGLKRKVKKICKIITGKF